MEEYIDKVKQRYTLDKNPYFSHLSDGSFAREDFVETQIQFLFAVVFFSRPMATLSARLPRPEQRFNMLKNVMEEHGNFDIRASHEKTFEAFLSSMDVEANYIHSRALWPAIRSFNSTLAAVCLLDDVYTAVAMLGIIEDLFSDISSHIGKNVVRNKWLKASEMCHYSTDKDLDEEHAEEFYQIISPLYGKSPEVDYQIQQGLELGAYIFMTMYKELYNSRQCRLERAIRGPHSSAEGWYFDENIQ